MPTELSWTETYWTLVIELTNWGSTLEKSHLIAMAGCYLFGYWLRGRRHAA